MIVRKCFFPFINRSKTLGVHKCGEYRYTSYFRPSFLEIRGTKIMVGVSMNNNLSYAWTPKMIVFDKDGNFSNFPDYFLNMDK